LVEPLLIYLFLAFPSGRLTTTPARRLMAASVLLVAVLYLPTALLVHTYPTPSPWTDCQGSECPGNAFMVLGSQPAFVDDVIVPVREALASILLLGVIGVLAPAASALTGLVDVLAPVLATGCTAVVVASAERPLPAVELAEVLATSDVPGGVVNLLTGRVAELGPWLAAHADVDGLDLAGAPEDIAVDLERAAADTVKRVLRPGTTGELARLRAWTELTTVWHPVGR